MAVGGGVICNKDGSWFVGFSSKYNVVSALAAELYVVRDALAMAETFKTKKVELYTDALSIKVMFDTMDANIHHKLADASNDVAVGINKLEDVNIIHIRRDLNIIVHELAEVGNDMNIGHITYFTPPDCVMSRSWSLE